MKTCTIEGCDKQFWARGMCPSHYKKWYIKTHGWSEKAREGANRRWKKWDSEHHDTTLEWAAKYRNEHKIECNQRVAEWAKNNPERLRAKDAKRRAQKLNACPSWANHEAIEAIYAQARRLSRATGILHHVDHIYPLVSPYVCGLHVAENLRVLVGSENLNKGNKF